MISVPNPSSFNSPKGERKKRTPMTTTFRKSNKNQQRYSTCWMCCPPDRMHSEQLQKTLFTLQFMPENLLPQWHKRSSAGNVITPPIYS